METAEDRSMAKAEASVKEALVERVVMGPKGIHCHDPKTGDRIFAKVGDTVHLPVRSARKFARYLEAPEVAKAKRKVAKAEEVAAGTRKKKAGKKKVAKKTAKA